MSFQRLHIIENKIFQIAKIIKDYTKIRGIFLKKDKKNKILICFPKGTPKFKIEELKVILKSKFPEEDFVFREYQKTIS